MFLLGSTRAALCKSLSCKGWRGIYNIVKPQAYLRTLVDSNGAEEFEGVMGLVLDRKEAKNALSVQMVGVSHALYNNTSSYYSFSLALTSSGL